MTYCPDTPNTLFDYARELFLTKQLDWRAESWRWLFLDDTYIEDLTVTNVAGINPSSSIIAVPTEASPPGDGAAGYANSSTIDIPLTDMSGKITSYMILFADRGSLTLDIPVLLVKDAYILPQLLDQKKFQIAPDAAFGNAFFRI